MPHVLLFNTKPKVCLSKSLSTGFSDVSFQRHLSTSSWEAPVPAHVTQT